MLSLLAQKTPYQTMCKNTKKIQNRNIRERTRKWNTYVESWTTTTYMMNSTTTLFAEKAESDFGKHAKFSKSNPDLGQLLTNCTIFCSPHGAVSLQKWSVAKMVFASKFFFFRLGLRLRILRQNYFAGMAES